MESDWAVAESDGSESNPQQSKKGDERTLTGLGEVAANAMSPAGMFHNVPRAFFMAATLFGSSKSEKDALIVRRIQPKEVSHSFLCIPCDLPALQGGCCFASQRLLREDHRPCAAFASLRNCSFTFSSFSLLHFAFFKSSMD
jgi:hypothetical protein